MTGDSSPMPEDRRPEDRTPEDRKTPRPELARGPARYGYLALGIACVGLGFVGYVTPVMPGTVFFIVALWAFKRSSPRLEAWLLTRSPVAGVLRDWDGERAMRRKTKILAIAMVWVGIGISIAFLVHKRLAEWRLVLSGASPASAHGVLCVPPLLFLTAVLLTLYIATRRTKIEGAGGGSLTLT